MILSPEDLALVRELAQLQHELKQEPSQFANLHQARQRAQSNRDRVHAIQRVLIEHLLADAISFDGVMGDGDGGLLLLFTDHAPASPAHAASFVAPLTGDTRLSQVITLRDEKRRQFRDGAAAPRPIDRHAGHQ